MKANYPLLIAFIMHMAAAVPSNGQGIPLQRLQLKLTTSFLFFSMQGQLDMDSAAIMVSEGEHLPYSLYYDEDYAKGPAGNIKQLLQKGSSFLFRSGAEKKDLDSALGYLQTARREAEAAKDTYYRHAVLAALGRYYLQSNDAPNSKRCFTEAVDLARKTNDRALLFRALANRGAYAGFKDADKESDLHEALQLSRQLRDTVGEIEMMTRVYEIDFLFRKFDTVKKQLLQVTELEKRIGFRHLHYNYDVLAYLDYTAGDYASAFADLRAAIATMEANHDLAFSNFIYGGMANIYARFDNYPKALEWLLKALRQEPENKEKRLWYHQLSGVCLNLSKFGHPQQALDAVLSTIRNYPPVSADNRFHIAYFLGYTYHRLDQNDSAAKYYAIMLPLMDSIRHDKEEDDKLFTANMDLATFYMDLGRPDWVKKYFKRAKVYTDPTNIFHAGRIHLLQSRIDSSEGDHRSAMREYKLAGLVDDSMFNLQRINQYTELQIQYETEAKNKDIQLLEQKDKAQQATLRQSEITKEVTLAGILAMVIITGLVYFQYRNKLKTNREINEKNLALEQLVRDKEWLVKEIHHRVKNNFHTVASLLEIQSSYLKSKDALSAIKESQHRIHSMSIIHQKLYQSDTLSTIHMPEYIYELVEYLRESYGIRGNITFSLQIEHIALNHASAITLGLILNEAITNSIKYAFSDSSEGQISISLSHISDSQILMSVADNGRGLPTDFESRIGATMGMELLQGLTDDLGGTFSIEAKNGTHIKVIFTVNR